MMSAYKSLLTIAAVGMMGLGTASDDCGNGREIRSYRGAEDGSVDYSNTPLPGWLSRFEFFNYTLPITPESAIRFRWINGGILLYSHKDPLSSPEVGVDGEGTYYPPHLTIALEGIPPILDTDGDGAWELGARLGVIEHIEGQVCAEMRSNGRVRYVWKEKSP